jgi:hypothetical protein
MARLVAPGALSQAPSFESAALNSAVAIPDHFTLIDSNKWPDHLRCSVLPPLGGAFACNCESLPHWASSQCSSGLCGRVERSQFCAPSDHGGYDCSNKFVIPVAALHLRKVGPLSRGLFTSQRLEPGEFVIEYCGSIVSTNDIRAPLDGGPLFFAELTNEVAIVGSCMGSLGVFANHSCKPNCHLVLVWVPDESLRVIVPRVFIAVGTDPIEPGSEITVRYNFARCNSDLRFPCFCGQGNGCAHLNDGQGPQASNDISVLPNPLPCHGKLGEIAVHHDAPANLSALQPWGLLIMTECVKLEHLRPGYASLALRDILSKHKLSQHFQTSSVDTWGGDDSMEKLGSDAAHRWEATATLFNVKFLASDRGKKPAIHKASAKALSGLLSFAPTQTFLDLRHPPAPAPSCQEALTVSRQELLAQLDVIWAQFVRSSHEVSADVTARATREVDPMMVVRNARDLKEQLVQILLRSFYALVPSIEAACTALGLASPCPQFFLKGPAAVALFQRKKVAELRHQWRLQRVSNCQFAKYHFNGCHPHLVRMGEVKSHANIDVLASEFKLTDFVDGTHWERTVAKPLTWESLYAICDLGLPSMQGNVVSTAKIEAVLYPPRCAWEFQMFRHWVVALQGNVYQNGHWVRDDGARLLPRALPPLVKGAVHCKGVPSAQVAAQQALLSVLDFEALAGRALSDGLRMAAQGGALHYQMDPQDAGRLAEFCSKWRELVDQHLDKEVYRRPINNGVEYFLMPSTSSADAEVNASRALVRAGAVRFALGLPWDAEVGVPAEVAGLSVLATHKGTFLRQLEVYLHSLAAEYGRQTGRNFVRMKTCAFSLLVFRPGSCQQQWHWDVLDTETIAINILVSRCSCGACSYKGTEVLKKPNGQWLSQLPKSCTRYCSTIKYVLQQHLPMSVLQDLVPHHVSQAVSECIAPLAAFESPSSLDSGGTLMYDNGLLGATAITCGPHRGPGHDGNCERMVLFMTMTRAIAQPYDSDDQVNAVDVIASVHGRHSLQYLWTIIDMELVRGIRAVGTIRGVTEVLKEECVRARFAVGLYDSPHLTLQTLMDSIVDVCNMAVSFCKSVPLRKGMVTNGIVHVTGISAQDGKDVAHLVFNYLSCEAMEESTQLQSLRARFVNGRVHQTARNRAGEIEGQLHGIKKVWKIAVTREGQRLDKRFRYVGAKLHKIAQKKAQADIPSSSKRKRMRRRSGPGAAKGGPLDSSDGSSSSGVYSPDSDDNSPVAVRKK